MDTAVTLLTGLMLGLFGLATGLSDMLGFAGVLLGTILAALFVH